MMPPLKKLDPLKVHGRIGAVVISGKTGTGRLSQRLLDGGASQREKDTLERQLAASQLSEFDAKLETKFALVSGMTSELAEEDRSSNNPGSHLGGRSTTGSDRGGGGGGSNTSTSGSKKTKLSSRFLPVNLGGGVLAPLGSTGMASGSGGTSGSGGGSGGSGGNGKGGGYQQGRRRTMLQEGNIRSPIFGLLAGVKPFQVRTAFDKLAQLNASTAQLTSLSLGTNKHH
jgi:hypothetical protein